MELRTGRKCSISEQAAPFLFEKGIGLISSFFAYDTIIVFS